MISDEIVAGPSETEQLREQLLRAQRLSSVGTLASSVAHEFNNILTTLINYAKLGQRPDATEATKKQAFEKILKGSQRAAVIISSMLGFARNTSTQRELVELAPLIDEALVLTDKDLSKHQIKVEKRFLSQPKVPIVRGQIEQILLNLIINARQAMQRGGRLTIDLRENTKTNMAEIGR